MRDVLEGLDPILGMQPRVLVLGSMPGAESLRMQQYYAHPRNHFWKIAEDVFGIPRRMPYEERVEGLKGKGIAVWDVLAECNRHGSLDSGIDRTSMRTNDIAALLTAHPGIVRILFNGIFAETVFRTRIGVDLSTEKGVATLRMPSTSPANASRPYEEKLAIWQGALRE